ncbi:MAG: hypothetical protein ABSF29_08045 [Tepidisphaeraceae bacterium]|jgi:hypothetical protein
MRRRLSWGTGIALVLIGAGLAARFYLQGQITAPTQLSLEPANLTALSPPWPDPAIFTPDEDADAGPLYRQALTAYQAGGDACEQFAQNPVDPPPDAIKLMLRATRKSSADLFIANPSEIVDYQTDHPALDQLCDLGRTMNRAALLMRQQNRVDQARAYFQSVYSLGKKLYDERLTYDEYSKGLALMDESTIGLAGCETGDRAEQLQNQEAAMRDYETNHVEPIYQALSTADQEEIALHAGDIFQFATQSQDRMIQVEAVLALGRLRFDAARNADQQAAPRYIAKAAASPDPAVQAAAAAAGGLTLEQYRMIH